MKVLVTGATGFVGGRLVSELVSHGLETVAVGGPKSENVAYSVDVGDAASLRRLEDENGVTCVVHLAGLAHRFGKVSDQEFRRVNVDGVENVAELAVRLAAKHFLLFSSTLVYGRHSGPHPITEDDHGSPFDPYGRSKLKGEMAARRVCEGAGMALTIFRPAPIIGEGSKGNLGRLIAAIDRRRFIWVGSGDNLKSIVYVGDVAKAAADVLAKGAEGTQVFNIAADPVRMSQIVDTIADKLGRKLPPVRLPSSAVKMAAAATSFAGGKFKRMNAMLDTWLGDDVYANNKLQAVYGFKPSTPLDEAIGREVEYYLKHK